MGFIEKFRIAMFFMLALLLAACGKDTPPGLRSSGDIQINGPGFTDSVYVGSQRLYMLKALISGNHYTLRTSILDGSLSLNVFTSETAMKNGHAPVASAAPVPGLGTIYEAQFTAPGNGDLVAVVSGKPLGNLTSQFYTDLHLMSASVLFSFATPTIPASDSRSIPGGWIMVYSGPTISPAGVYSVSLTSTGTSTLLHPQMYIYEDSSLSISKLLYSSLTTSVGYSISRFATSPTLSVLSTELSFTNIISSVTFTGSGPYIVLKGNSTIDYTLGVMP